MTVRRISAGPGLPTGFPFSLASGGNGLLFISGMPALDADGSCGAGDFLYVQVLLGDIGSYAGLNDWWRRQFPDPAMAPARLTYQAGALPFGAKIEFQVVAQQPDAGR